MKYRTIHIMLMAVVLFCSCSKDNEHHSSIETEKGYLPKTVFLEYNTDQTVAYKLTYTPNNQIGQMVIHRISGADSTQITVDFSYNGNGNLISAKTSTNDTESIMTFDYDAQNAITDMRYTIDGAEKEINVLDGETPHSHVLEGEFGLLPIQLEYDSLNNLMAMGYGDNVYMFNYTEFSTGIFYHKDVQPALHIWNSFILYLAPSEMYFFSKKELDGFTVEDGINPPMRFDYSDKLWDGHGNLIGFQLRRGGFVLANGSNTIMKCTITYESKDL